MCDRMPCPPLPKRLRISELNPHLLCALCGGYLIDATTIIECLHSFCKTCILRYLETSNYCPICEVLIHKTRPWQNIRLDHSLQNAVYKMVPGLFQNEMRRRREFYDKQNVQDKRGRPSNQPQGELGDRIIFSQDEEFSISIEFSPDGKPVKEISENKSKSLKRPKGNCPPDKRYLKCPAGLRIEHLKKFIRSKFTLPQTVEIDLFYETETLNETFSLMDVAYIYSWKRDCVLRLFYSFYETPSKLRKLETVTNITEVSKSKMKDKNSQEKRDNDKMTKSKKDKSKEKRQSKLSGKRKVNADCSTSTTNGVSNPDQVCAAALAVKSDSNAKSNIPDLGHMCSSQNMTFLPCESASKTEQQCNSNPVPDRCTNTCPNSVQSSTKQKPSPENTSYSVIAHSSTKEGNTPKGPDAKASLKLLIKSSDIKDGKSPNADAMNDGNDRKYQSCQASSNVKVKKWQNGETHGILKSNLFEKMDTFAKCSQAEHREFTATLSYHSSLVQNPPNKRFKSNDVKCDMKVNVITAEANGTNKTINSVSELKPECVAAAAVEMRNVVGHSAATSLGTGEHISAKPLTASRNNNDKADTGSVTAKDVNITDTKPFEKDSTIASKIDGQSITAAVKETNVIKQEGRQIKINEKKKAGAEPVSTEPASTTHNSLHKTQAGFKYVTQDNNQNETKVARLDDAHNAVTSKQNSFKQPACETRMAVTEPQHKIVTLDDPKQRREETKQNTSKPISAGIQHRNVKQSVDDVKHRNGEVKHTTPEVKSFIDTARTTSIKPSADDADRLVKSHNLVTIKTEAIHPPTSVISNKVVGQGLSKAGVNSPRNNGPSLYSRDQNSLKTSAEAAKAEKKPQEQATKEQKEYVPLTTRSTDVSAPPSKPLVLVSNPSQKVAPAEPQVKAQTSQPTSSPVNPPTNGPALAASNKQPMVSRGATITTSCSTLPAPPKLLKTTLPATTSSSSYTPTSYTVASMVSAPSVTASCIPTSPVIGKSVAHSTPTVSVASSIAKVSRSCEVTSTMSAKTTPSLPSAPTASKATLSVPSTSTATASRGPLASSAKDTLGASAKEVYADSKPPYLVFQRKQPDTTLAPSDAPSKTSTSASAPPKASLAATTATSTTPNIALSVITSPVASSASSSTTVTSSITASPVATSADNWSSNTILNVANTFLHIPLTEARTVKETPARNNTKSNAAQSSNILKQKESIKLDNFLYDTKSLDIETTVSSHNVKESCTVMKQAHKSLLRTKPNPSAQIHGLAMSKSSKHQGPHITAIHNLPKTISQTSKPYSMARSMSVSSNVSSKCNMIQTTKISTLIPKSSSIASKAGSLSKSFSYPSTINNVPSSRSFLHTSLASHLSRSEIPAVINGSSGYDRAMLTKGAAFPATFSLQTVSPASSITHHRASSSSKHSSKDGDSKLEKSQKNKSIPPLTIPKSCLVGTTLKLQRSPGSTDYIFAPLSHYGPTSHHNGERSRNKDGKHNGSRAPTSPTTSTDDRLLIGERQRVPTIKISDINRNPIIVDSSASGNGSSGGGGGNRHNPPYRSFSHGSSRSSSSDNGSARTHSRGGSDSSSPTGSSDKSDRSPARDARRPSDSELLLSQHWHGYSAADLLFNGFKLPTHPKFHDLHYDTDAMPLDYSQSSSKS